MTKKEKKSINKKITEDLNSLQEYLFKLYKKGSKDIFEIEFTRYLLAQEKCQ